MYSDEQNSARPCTDADIENSLIDGYKEMSRINLSLADSAICADNEALVLSEQKLAECE